jgi:competence protein ComEA
VDRVLPWRVLEVPEAEATTASDAGPDSGSPPGARRAIASGALAIAALFAAAIALLLVLAGPRQGTLVIDGAPGPVEPGTESGSFDPDAALVAGQGLVVDVAGAVLHPGVYHLPAGSRVADAIGAAGGIGPRVDAAAAQALNLAAPLVDGMQVRVPSRDDETSGAGGATGAPATGTGTASSGVASHSLVDLNAASSAELDALPGIGPVTAAKIIASRAEKPFAAVRDLQTRKLVGAATFAKLAGLVTVSPR